MPIGKTKQKVKVLEIFDNKKKEREGRDLNSSAAYMLDTSTNKLFDKNDSKYRTHSRVLDARAALTND